MSKGTLPSFWRGRRIAETALAMMTMPRTVHNEMRATGSSRKTVFEKAVALT